MNASSNVSQLDALHLELLHAAIPQQYDTIGVMMPVESAVVLRHTAALRNVFAVRARKMWSHCLRHF